jgi:hypothetical protein
MPYYLSKILVIVLIAIWFATTLAEPVQQFKIETSLNTSKMSITDRATDKKVEISAVTPNLKLGLSRFYNSSTSFFTQAGVHNYFLAQSSDSVRFSETSLFAWQAEVGIIYRLVENDSSVGLTLGYRKFLSVAGESATALKPILLNTPDITVFSEMKLPTQSHLSLYLSAGLLLPGFSESGYRTLTGHHESVRLNTEFTKVCSFCLFSINIDHVSIPTELTVNAEWIYGFNIQIKLDQSEEEKEVLK